MTSWTGQAKTSSITWEEIIDTWAQATYTWADTTSTVWSNINQS